MVQAASDLATTLRLKRAWRAATDDGEHYFCAMAL
jgi:hypothetical protein